MTDESLAALPDAAPERRRGSGVRLVYETLRDEILDLVLPSAAGEVTGDSELL